MRSTDTYISRLIYVSILLTIFFVSLSIGQEKEKLYIHPIIVPNTVVGLSSGSIDRALKMIINLKGRYKVVEKKVLSPKYGAKIVDNYDLVTAKRVGYRAGSMLTVLCVIEKGKNTLVAKLGLFNIERNIMIKELKTKVLAHQIEKLEMNMGEMAYQLLETKQKILSSKVLSWSAVLVAAGIATYFLNLFEDPNTEPENTKISVTW